MPPLVLMLIDSVFGLALHHHRRASTRPVEGFASTEVRAELCGPMTVEPAPGGIRVRIVICSTRETGASQVEHVELFVDLAERRLLAAELALAELPIDRSAAARVIGELEAWCYARLPMDTPEPQDASD